MKETTTLKEIELFLDEKLNYKSKEQEEKKWGISTHQIRQCDHKSYYTIYIVNSLTSNFDIGGMRLDKRGAIWNLGIDSFYLASEIEHATRDLYVGTDMRKELKERFVGKKLVGYVDIE